MARQSPADDHFMHIITIEEIGVNVWMHYYINLLHPQANTNESICVCLWCIYCVLVPRSPLMAVITNIHTQTHTQHTHTHISQWSLKLPNERSVLTMTDAAPRYLPLNLSCESLSVVHLFLIVWPLYPMLASFAQGNALSTLCSLILLQLLSSFSTAITSALTVECVNERKKIWVFAALIMWVYIIKLYTFLQQHYSIRNTSKVTVVSFKKYSSISPVRPK